MHTATVKQSKNEPIKTRLCDRYEMNCVCDISAKLGTCGLHLSEACHWSFTDTGQP